VYYCHIIENGEDIEAKKKAATLCGVRRLLSSVETGYGASMSKAS